MAAGLRLSLLLALVPASAASLAQPARAGSVFSCLGPNGKPMTGDRELVGCVGDQYEHGADGSRRRVVPRARSDSQELERISARWDETLSRLKILWPRLSAPRK